MRFESLVALAACGCASTSTPPPVMAESVTVGEGGVSASGGAATGSAAGMVPIAPGFAPDPLVVLEGETGEGMYANTLSPECVGTTTEEPTAVVSTLSNFPYLRVFVQSQGDTTLAVQRPDGSVICNDDFAGLNPAVEGTFRTGVYRVWVGTYGEEPGTPFQLAVTTNSAIGPGAL
ncbi:MAG: hypothetical protein AAF645_16465 [Myxococcota bacterium]